MTWRGLGLMLFAAAAALAQEADPAVMVVKGIGAEKRAPYDGGGVVRFKALRFGAQVAHVAGDRLLLPLSLDYAVEQTAPIQLTSDFGSEYWTLHDISEDRPVYAHSTERIDLGQAGDATASVESVEIDSRRGNPVTSGLLSLRDHFYFVIKPREGGEWIDVATPPAWFMLPERRRMQVTVADLTRYRLAVGEVRASWRPGSLLRLRLDVIDAQDRRLPVVGCAASLTAGGVKLPLATQYDLLDCPTGWLTATLPNEVAESWQFDAEVTLATPDGLKTERVTATVRRGQGEANAELDEQHVLREPELPRDAQGRLLETRALWVALHNIRTPEQIADAVARAKAAGFNVLLPDVFLNDEYLPAKGGYPQSTRVTPGFDPLAAIIAAGHAAGMEVHPWFTIAHRDAAARARLGNPDIITRAGKVVETGADLHRPEYRDFIVNLLTTVAKEYEVDGIHFDYIRVMEDCYCDKCRAEFAAKYGKPLTEATSAEWQAWHREAVGDIVKRTGEGVRAVRPNAMMSAAVYAGRTEGARQGQDPAGWANAGWLDWVVTMDYLGNSLLLRARERSFLNDLKDPARLVSGLSLFGRHGAEARMAPNALLAQQVRVVRRLGVGGWALFVDDYLKGDAIDAVKALHDPPAIPRKPE